LEKPQSHCLFTSEDCFDGVIIDATGIVGVAQSPAGLLIVCEFLKLVLECIDEETSPRDIEDFNNAISALDERFGGKIDAGFLFSYHCMWRVYT
jgi:hypothetical protein